MSAEERRVKKDEVHLLLAFRRRKENEEGRTVCIRHVCKDEDFEKEAQILKAKVEANTDAKGTWRIHRTINSRSTTKAFKIFQHKLLDIDDAHTYLDSLWKTCLLQPQSKTSRNLLLDIDTKDEDTLLNVMTILKNNNVEPCDVYVETPNGRHIVCKNFDKRMLDGIEDVEVKKDAFVFMDMFTI
jgi:hypothetical protein